MVTGVARGRCSLTADDRSITVSRRFVDGSTIRRHLERRRSFDRSFDRRRRLLVARLFRRNEETDSTVNCLRVRRFLYDGDRRLRFGQLGVRLRRVSGVTVFAASSVASVPRLVGFDALRWRSRRTVVDFDARRLRRPLLLLLDAEMLVPDRRRILLARSGVRETGNRRQGAASGGLSRGRDPDSVAVIVTTNDAVVDAVDAGRGRFVHKHGHHGSVIAVEADAA